MTGSGQFWQKWWFWLLAAAVVVTLPFSVKYAFAEPEESPGDGVPRETAPVEPPEADPGPASYPAEDPEEDIETEPETKPESESEPETEPETEVETEPELEPEPETEPETEVETEPESEPEPENEVGTEPESGAGKEAESSPTENTYVLNRNTKKFHFPDCSSVKDIQAKNREETTLSRDALIAEGYAPCGRCKP